MRRWVLIGLVGLGLFTVVGFVLTYIPKVRRNADVVVCQEHLSAITLFAAHHAKPQPGVDPTKLPPEIPAGTIVLPDVPPEDRLSWYVRVLPGLDQRRQNTRAILGAVDEAQPWSAEKNQLAGRAKVVTLLCPGNPAISAADEPAPTQYVGIAGLGADAATLVLAPPAPTPPRAGCFRYDSPTPFSAITDGLSQTILLGERSGDVGPWLRGGPATVRGLDDSPGAKPLMAAGGQFGGCHPNGANWAFADGSGRFFTDRVDPKVLFGMATIAGRESDPIPGE
jgi:prepilin-type processing-associated H-X9-DG protein